MPYVQRDASGNITGAFFVKQDFASEYVADTDPDLVSFMDKIEAMFVERAPTGTPPAGTP